MERLKSDVRFILSDMDGTLLDGSNGLDNEIFDLVDMMDSKGILFGVASGRQLFTLKNIFAPVSEKVLYICENGSYIHYRGEDIFASIIDSDTVASVIDATTGYSGIPILCGKECAYTSSPAHYKKFTVRWDSYNMKLCGNLYECCDKDIIKIGINHSSDITYMSDDILHKLSGLGITAEITGKKSIDCTNQGTDKGSAVRIVQKKFNISYYQTAAFGDYYNDIGLFNEAFYSYAVENALEDVKKAARFIAGRNTEKGVVNAIKKLVC